MFLNLVGHARFLFRFCPLRLSLHTIDQLVYIKISIERRNITRAYVNVGSA